MSESPSGWAFTELANVATSVTDGDHQAPPQTAEGIPFLVIGNLRKGRLEFSNCRHVPTEYYQSLASIRRPQKGDILYSLVGTYGICVLVADDRPFCVQRHIGIIRPSTHINNKFLAFAMSSREVYAQVTSYATGTAQLTVPLSGLRRVKIPIAPPAEQTRVVAAIEEQFSRIDAGEAALERSWQSIKRMRSAVLQAAVRGHLFKSPTEIRQDNRQPELPSEWRRVRVADIAQVSGGITKSPKRSPQGNAYPFLRVANVLRGRLDLNEVHEIELFPGELERLRLQRSDLLVVEGNGSPDQIGRSALWDGSIDPCVHQNHLIRVRPSAAVLPEYLNVFWNAPSTGEALRSSASSTSGLHTLSTGKIRKIEVALPPLPEQYRIAEEVDRQLSALTDLDRRVQLAKQRARALRTAVLSMAFEGRLVPQHPEDRPASLFLKQMPQLLQGRHERPEVSPVYGRARA